MHNQVVLTFLSGVFFSHAALSTEGRSDIQQYVSLSAKGPSDIQQYVSVVRA